MAALLAILFFAAFITLDWALSRRRERREAEAGQSLPSAPMTERALEAEPELEPVFVAGYEMPERLHDHRGHTWVRLTGPDTAVVGVDDFGRRLLGNRIQRIAEHDATVKHDRKLSRKENQVGLLDFRRAKTHHLRLRQRLKPLNDL